MQVIRKQSRQRAEVPTIQKNFYTLFVFGEKRELEVGSLAALQGVVEHLLHRRPIFLGDVYIDQTLTHHFCLREASDFRSFVIPAMFLQR